MVFFFIYFFLSSPSHLVPSILLLFLLPFGPFKIVSPENTQKKRRKRSSVKKRSTEKRAKGKKGLKDGAMFIDDEDEEKEEKGRRRKLQRINGEE